MKLDPHADAARLQSEEGTRRNHGRLPQETLACNLGEVLDLSAGGMRVLCRRVPSGETVVQICGWDKKLALRAKVAWSRRVGFFKHEAGIMFLDLTETQARELNAIAANHRLRRAI